LISLLLAAFLQQQRAGSDAACIKCHESQQDDWKGSIHEQKGVGCVKCHGADTVDNKSKPHLFTPGFLRGTKKTNPALCAKCHEPEHKAFDEGAHGEDTRDETGMVKGCSSCHEFHSMPVADRKAIVKEKCSPCHKPGSQKIKWAERYSAIAGRLDGDALKRARIGQHAVLETFLREIDKPAAVPPRAYNNGNAGPPWGVTAAAVAALGTALGWILRGQGRRAS
jgi:hypothetical protein